MLIKRIFWTLLITGVITLSTTVTQAQATGRKPWPRGNAVNNPVPTVPDQAAERAPVAELLTASQEWQAAERCDFLCILERQKTAIVGTWLGTSGEGNKLLQSFTSDGIMFGSVQGEVSTNPELGVLTPGHGVWKHLGGRQFGFTAVGLLYDINTGAYLGYLKARVLLTLNEAGDQMSGTDKVEIFGPDGSLVFTATGNTSYKRIKAEPFN
ncbi:MAG: hypothetical protein M3X11_05445 [Acidobacteriota bacterium]|nr:hypothetical protein [Acidobacteriota bacterium]